MQCCMYCRRPAAVAAVELCSEAPPASRPWVSLHSLTPPVTRLHNRQHARMATSATATATMAAAGFDKRASTASSLQTPGSGTFPSELCSPMAVSPGFLKQRDADLKTPITPPSAYLDFLKSMSPAIMSPATSSTSARFSFNEKQSEKSFERSFENSSDKGSEASLEKHSTSPPTCHPPLSRNSSHDSASSVNTTTTASSERSTTSTAGASGAASTGKVRPESPRVTIPPSPFAKPAPKSARTPRLRIPQSPFSPVPGSAHSAHSATSPFVPTPLSAAPWSASYERNVDTEANGQPGRVSVRQVVTRTVTYCRTPLEPAPNGNLWKRRKIEHDDTGPKPIPEESCNPIIKEERQEDAAVEKVSSGPAVSTD